MLMRTDPAFSIKIRDLRKSFDRHPAVDGLDLAIRCGEFYTLLGPNGAGKTTTLRMVVGLLQPDAGSICVLGIDALADPVAAPGLSQNAREILRDVLGYDAARIETAMTSGAVVPPTN